MRNAEVLPLWPEFKPESALNTDRADLSEAFEKFWQTWRSERRQGKAKARAKYMKIVTTGLKTKTRCKDSGCFEDLELEATPEEIQAGAEAYMKSFIDPRTFRLRDEGKFICLPETWLNQGRWMDWI